MMTTESSGSRRLWLSPVLKLFRLLFLTNAKASAASVLVLLLLFAVSSYVILTLLLASCIGGLMLGYFILSPGILFPNFLVSHVRVRRSMNLNDELNLLKKFCTSCGRENCRRHKPELNVLALRPWLTIRVPEKVNSALEEFFNLVLQEFVSPWYSVLSKDGDFADEIRKNLRFIVSMLLRRLERVDLPSLITGRVLNTALIHLNYCLQVTSRDVPVTDIEQAVLDLYGHRLHCALRNRKAELDYLVRFSDKVFPYILPPHSIKCESLCVLLREVLSGKILLPAMDVLADPDIVNNILLILFDKSPLHKCTDPPSPLVPILGFSNIPQQKSDLNLQLSLSDILADNNLLYLFIQFMKSESSVNVIQFYLSIEEFNGDILTPELTKEQLQDLHRTLRDLYNNYIDPNSVNCIGFDEDIVSQLKELCDGDAEGVVKLQTTTPLFKAYEHAYDLLEHVFLPLFHQSNEYYIVVWGERRTEMQRSSSKSSKNPTDPLSLSGIGNRLKTVLRGNTVEGRPVSEVADDTEIGSLATSLSDSLIEGASSHQLLLDDGPLRDLSAWRVSIPEIIPRPDPDNPRKSILMFSIEVRRVDVLENDFEMSCWSNFRRYNEFYVLEQKLVEFHGEFEDAQLPSKKTFVQKNRAFLESQRESFELYLQKLLTKPVLRNSELLYSFLYTDIEFTMGFLEVNLGKKVKSGALKLVKERGQHIDAFLKSFLLSTENPKSRPSRWSDKDSDTISISSDKGSIYCNNANCDLTEMPTTSSTDSYLYSETHSDNVGGVYDAVIYLVLNLYNAPIWFLRLLMIMRTVLRNTIDTFLDWYLGQKIEKVMQEYHLIKIIHLLRDALFFDNDPPRTDEDKRLRQSAALSQLLSFIPNVFVKAVGSENYHRGTCQFFNFLQFPRLNKQLSYMLLDIAIEELFPELFSDVARDSNPSSSS